MGAGRGGHAYHGRYVRGFVPLGIPRMGAFGVTMARGTMGDCDSGLKVSPELVSTKPSSRSTPPLFEPSSFLRVKVTTVASQAGRPVPTTGPMVSISSCPSCWSHTAVERTNELETERGSEAVLEVLLPPKPEMVMRDPRGMLVNDVSVMVMVLSPSASDESCSIVCFIM